MADIKVRDVAKKTVKAIDKSAIATERFKDTIVHTKERAENATNEDGNINEYGSSKIGFVSNRTVDESVHQFNKQGKKSLIQTKDNYSSLLGDMLHPNNQGMTAYATKAIEVIKNYVRK